MRRALPVLLAALAAPARAQQSQPVPDQHVTVPSAPGQPNTETVVQPSSGLKQGDSGWVLQGDQGARSGARRETARPTNADASPFPGATSPPAARAPSAPAGPAVVEAAYVTVRGTLKTVTKDSITVVEKSGRPRQVSLAPRALVAEGLKPGDEVVLRIPFGDGTGGRTADRVERPSAPKPAPRSKFAQAQATGS
jgi:hypothetical protein